MVAPGVGLNGSGVQTLEGVGVSDLNKRCVRRVVDGGTKRDPGTKVYNKGGNR